FEEEMKKCKVPKWFIESCKRIKYLFPKAHAVAYVMMAFRIAYFKVHHPLAFYATYFTVKGDEFNTIVILKGPKAIKERLNELSGIIHKNVKEKAEETNLLLALEMMMRGFKFLPVNIFLSDPRVFKIEGDGLRIPLNKIPGLGDKLAKSIDRARSKRPFTSVEDMIRRTGITKANVETMRELHMLDDLPEKEQISLF
ncbi:MAG TPA: PolC-type DNA polymerase III, partial [Thermotogales bacterium]|nr:PolC-type DNA polymerase III [Thermotogales bacterium]